MTTLKEYYSNLHAYTRSVAEGHHPALFVHSPHGIGKTYQVLKVLRAELDPSDYVHHSGHSTPLSFYQFLYRHKDQVVFLDDVGGLLQEKDILSNLKQATWTAGDLREVTWNSTADIDDYPNSFIFSGRVIMCFNQIPNNPIMKSLISRCLYYKLDFTYDERIDIMRKIAKNNLHIMDEEQRLEVIDWLEEQTYPTSGVDIRTLINSLEFRKYDPDSWQKRCKGLLESQGIIKEEDDLALIEKLLAEHEYVKDAKEEFCGRRDYSERAFWNKKKKLEEQS